MIWKALILLPISLFAFILYHYLPQKPLALTKPIFQSNTLSKSGEVKTLFEPHLPSLNTIFSDNHSWVATASAENIRTIIATGDIIPARSVNFQVLQRKDFNWPYLKTFGLTQNADITLANLESPQIKNCPATNEGMIFCGDWRNIQGLKFAGVDIVSLANNHAGNYGREGIRETIEYLQSAGIDSVGSNFANLVIKDIRGVKFAFLGFNDVGKNQPGVSNVDEEEVKSKVAQAKAQADVVIIAFHWGTEYQSQPDARQKYLGRLAIDSGADLIIGNHPHWIQPIEIYKGKLITYAHGNFVFDQMWSQKTKEGVVGKYTFYNNSLIDVEYFPVQINEYGQPALPESAQRRSILDQMNSESLKLQGKIY